MRSAKRTGSLDWLLTVALAACLGAGILGFAATNASYRANSFSLSEWSCWISPCIANGLRKNPWEMYVPLRFHDAEAMVAGVDGTIVVAREGMLRVLTPFEQRWKVLPIEANLRSVGAQPPPSSVAIGANGTIAVVDRDGVVRASVPPYDNWIPGLTARIGSSEAVAVGPNGTIAVVVPDGFLMVSTRPYERWERLSLGPTSQPTTMAVGPDGTIALVHPDGRLVVSVDP